MRHEFSAPAFEGVIVNSASTNDGGSNVLDSWSVAKGNSRPALYCMDHLPGTFLQPLDSLVHCDESSWMLDSPYGERTRPYSFHAPAIAAAIGVIGLASPVAHASVGVAAFTPSAVRNSESMAPVPASNTFHLDRYFAASLSSSKGLAAVSKGAIDVRTFDGRLEELRLIAAEDEVVFSESSADDLQQLLLLMPIAVAPSLFLSDSGNIRASWRSSLQKHASFEFIGNGKVKPVIFSHDNELGIDNQIYGIVSLNVIPSLLRTSGLGNWILA